MERTPLLPLPEGMLIDQLQITANGLVVSVIATHPTSSCPLCSEASSSIKSHYRRSLHDGPCGGRRIQLTLTVRTGSISSNSRDGPRAVTPLRASARELVEQGYKGSYASVHGNIVPLLPEGRKYPPDSSSRTPALVTERLATFLFLRRPEKRVLHAV